MNIEKNKLFVATFFEDQGKKFFNLLAQIEAKEEKGLRVVPKEKLHITWKFIGYIDTAENKKIFDIVKRYSDVLKNAYITFDKLEVWPNTRFPRLLSITSRNCDKKFKDYFNILDKSLFENIGVEREKKRFIPHITIARMKPDKKADILKGFKFEPVKIIINKICVVQSITDSNGALYKILYEDDF